MQQDRKRKEVASRNQALCSSHPLGDQKGESKPVLSSAGSTAVGRGSWGEVIGIRSLKPEKERQERQTSNFSREVILPDEMDSCPFGDRKERENTW